MNVLIENIGAILAGFRTTLALFIVSAFFTMILGTALGVMRVVPIIGMRVFASVYVNVIRSTPPVLIFFIFTLGLPILGIRQPFFVYAVIALTVYEASFISEAVKAGINFVSHGQSEAARSLGMSGTQLLRYVILPQAMRNTIPPVANYMISLCKATSIAGTFGVVEATIELKYLSFENPEHVFVIFSGIALGYVIINFSIAGLLKMYERRAEMLA